MSVKTISKDELRRMEGSEGLIIQGCGGSLDEWVDGINDMLTEEGILLGGTRFHDCSTFEHDGSTCLLFPFKDDVNAQLRSKQEEIQPVRCDVACIVELSNAEFYDFQFNPLADHDFIKEHLPDLKTDAFHAIPCMLVLGEGVDDGILVDPQGYDYARYTAYIPMARQLFQNKQVESVDDAIEEDDLEEEPFQGMTM